MMVIMFRMKKYIARLDLKLCFFLSWAEKSIIIGGPLIEMLPPKKPLTNPARELIKIEWDEKFILIKD